MPAPTGEQTSALKLGEMNSGSGPARQGEQDINLGFFGAQLTIRETIQKASQASRELTKISPRNPKFYRLVYIDDDCRYDTVSDVCGLSRSHTGI